MPKGAVLSEGSSGDNITHFAAMRVRVTGNGFLVMGIASLDLIKTKTFQSLSLAPTNRVFQTRIINFVEQRASLVFKTTGLGERFRIKRITVFMKEMATSHPGN